MRSPSMLLGVVVLALTTFLPSLRARSPLDAAGAGKSLSSPPASPAARKGKGDKECEARLEELRETYRAAKTFEERTPAILEFARAPCKATVEFLAQLYEKDDNTGMHMTITRTLGRIGTKDAIDVVLKAGVPSLGKDLFASQAIAEAFESRLEPAAEKLVLRWFQSRSRLHAEMLKNTELWQRIVRAIARFRSKDRIKTLTRAATQEKSPELVVAILEALEEEKSSTVVSAARRLLRHRNPDVQVAAYSCLFAQDGKKSGAKFVRGLTSRHWQVRLISLRFLSKLEDPRLLRSAVKMLDDPEARVQLTAVQALLNLGGKQVLEPLIARLATSQGRLQDDLADTLARLTGRDLGPGAAQWESWWVQFRDVPGNYVRLSAEEFSELKAESERKQQTLLYYGLRVLADSVFVVDTSESMAERYVPRKDREEPRGKTVVENPPTPPSDADRRQRIEVARNELLTVLKGLKNGKKFNIVRFDSALRDFIQDTLGKRPERLERMLPKVREKAKAFVSEFEPAGQTYMLKALREAFAYPDVEVIYLLSDGAPTPESGDMADILAYVRKENRLRSVKINTIGFDLEEKEKKFLLELADENFGVFIER
ncbi:MAG: HEAT repeat domain-containing protein [Planctomycetota bacterium]|nr:HEAT repeat domain-containing protein [Planctomycetota bacterium]